MLNAYIFVLSRQNVESFQYIKCKYYRDPAEPSVTGNGGRGAGASTGAIVGIGF